MASKPTFRPRPRPRPHTFGLNLASISLSYYVIGHFPGKNRVKFGNFVNFPAIVLNRILLIIIWYFFIIIFGLGLGLNSRNWPRPQPRPRPSSASRFWPRLTSLVIAAVMGSVHAAIPRD